MFKDAATRFKLVPVPNEDNEEIVIPNEDILRFENKIYIDRGNKYVKKLKEADECTKNLVIRKYEHCKKILNKNFDVIEITKNILLIKNAKNESLVSNCNNQTYVLNKNYLINFSNCTIRINNEAFTNKETIRKYEIVLPNYSKPKDVKFSANLEEIHIKQIENIQKITELNSKSKTNQILTYLIMSFFVSLIIIVIILCFVNKKTVKTEILRNRNKNTTGNIQENIDLNGGGIISADIILV